MPFQYLVAPFVIWLVVAGWLWFNVDEAYAVWGIPPAIILAVLIVSRKQINWWWFQRNTPELDAPIKRLLENSDPFYQSLFPNERAEFRRRVVLYVLYHKFKGMGLDELPNDLRAGVAIKAVTISLRQDDFLMKKFAPIFLYGHPFPTPRHNEFHTVEVDGKDGAVILSAPQLMAGVLNPRKYYDTGLHAFAEVYRHLYPHRSYPEFEPANWQRLERIGRFSKNKVLNTIGLPEEKVSLWPVAVVTFFHHAVAFRREWPEMFDKIAALLKN